MISIRLAGGASVAAAVVAARRGTSFPESNGRHLPAAEPARRVDAVSGDKVLSHGVGLFLRENLGEVRVLRLVGICSDHDFGCRPLHLFKPAPHLVELAASIRIRINF